MADGWAVRAGRVGDVGAVVELERRVPEAPHWNELEYRAVFDGGVVRRALFVADRRGEVVGFTVGSVRGELGELESVAVAAELRRLGVGRALCAAVQRWCRGEGARELELEVRAGSLGAVEMYRGLGFAEAGRRRGYYREPADDALLMRMPL